MLSQEIKDQIRKDVQNEMSLRDAIFIMEQYLSAYEDDHRDYYKEKMQEFVNKHK